MYSWLEQQVQGIPEMDYLVYLGLLIIALAVLLTYSYGAIKRYRFMAGTATSRIRSAAQGYAELKGLGEWMPDDTIHSPFSKSRCIWYHCSIDEKTGSGKRSTWTNIADYRSNELFQLVDETGVCIIDPEEARVTPEYDYTWYGSEPGNVQNPPVKSRWLQLSSGRYRFRERLIRPACKLYVLGDFRTMRNDLADATISDDISDTMRLWKREPGKFLRKFDTNQNGKIEGSEWKMIRAAARQEVLSKSDHTNQQHHVISKPGVDKLPYIISAVDEDELVAKKKLWAGTAVTASFMTLGIFVLLVSVRMPLSI